VDAIVVLGARVHAGGVPSGALVARVERAVELFHEGRAEKIVFSGGVGAHPPAEAEVACTLAVSLGVPRDACLLEAQSRNTYENARFCAPILRGGGFERVWLVTDPFHCYRARQHFWRLGIDVVPVPTRRAQRLRWWLRELPALLRAPSLLFARRPGPRR
jgi:uncharacterized SAM-binding protein YcdF (DUF218 family)